MANIMRQENDINFLNCEVHTYETHQTHPVGKTQSYSVENQPVLVEIRRLIQKLLELIYDAHFTSSAGICILRLSETKINE